MAIPVETAIASSTFTIFGVEMRCHVLSGGQRIIEADCVEKLFAAMGEESPVTDEDVTDMEALARFIKGKR